MRLEVTGGGLPRNSRISRETRKGWLPSDARVLTAAALLVVAVLFGGGGSRAGIANLVVQLAALIAIAFHRDAFFGFFKEAPRSVTVLVAVTMLLPLLQCVPLPPAIWHQLPGRELAIEALALIGEENSWMPFSVNAQRTFIAFLSLLPPFAALVLSWRASDDDRRFLMLVLVACAVAGIILGAQQLASGNWHFMFYAQAVGSQDLQGTFANRNTAGLFADIALCCLVGLLWQNSAGFARIAVGSLSAALLLLGLFLTRSRSSMVLAIIPASMFLAYLWNARHRGLIRQSGRLYLIAAFVVLAVAVGLLANNDRVKASLDRFDTFQDARAGIWEDTRSSIVRFWPLGSGVGTFDEVFQIDESLENLGPGRAARAHNEYLETALELGILGPALLVGWMLIVATFSKRGFYRSPDNGPQIAVAASFLLLAFQSILDYPMRSQTLLCLAGMMLGILIAEMRLRPPVV